MQTSAIRFAAATAAALISGCSPFVAAEPGISVSVSPQEIELTPSDSMAFVATVTDATGQVVSGTVAWRSSDTDVVRVAGDGSARIVGQGTARVIAQSRGHSASGVVTASYPPLTGIREYAHRAFAGLYPENTLVAVQRSFDRGADGVEVDVALTNDGVAVVMHDPTVDRTTDGHGAVRLMSFAQIRALDACSKRGPQWAPCPVPTATEIIDAAHGRGYLILDLKGPWPLDGLANLMREVRDRGMSDSTMVTSFSFDQLLAVRRQDPRVTLGLLETDLANPEDFFRLGRTAFLIGVPAIKSNPNLASAYAATMRANGSLLGAWTLYDATDVSVLQSASVSWYITDVPLNRATLVAPIH